MIFVLNPLCRPWRGWFASGCALSHPDKVGVGYGISSLRDFRQEEVRLLCGLTNEHYANADEDVTP